MNSQWSLQARWLFPVDRKPIPNGILRMAGGKITSIESSATAPVDVDLGSVAVLPGIVNSHTHLDLSELRSGLPQPDCFTEWLETVIEYRRSSTSDDWQTAIRASIRECIHHGTTLIGDISANGDSHLLLKDSPIRSLVFHEIIGLREERASETTRNASTWLEDYQQSNDHRLGLSPHAPYSVRQSLYQWCSEQRLPIATHFAETLLEEELLKTQSGEMADFLKRLGAFDSDALVSCLADIPEFFEELDQPVLYVHGNYLNDVIIEKIKQQNATVIYCPRTHAYFKHPVHPYQRLLKEGINVALGTDSLASNPDLSIWNEMKWIWKHDKHISGADLLKMGTLAGAQALGFDDMTGSLSVGKSADMITIPIPESSEAVDPYQLLFQSPHEIRDVCIQGKWIIRGGAFVGE